MLRSTRLAGLFVAGVRATPLAVFAQRDPLGIVALGLVGLVVAPLAFLAREGDADAHVSAGHVPRTPSIRLRARGRPAEGGSERPWYYLDGGGSLSRRPRACARGASVPGRGRGRLRRDPVRVPGRRRGAAGPAALRARADRRGRPRRGRRRGRVRVRRGRLAAVGGPPRGRPRAPAGGRRGARRDGDRGGPALRARGGRGARGR